MMRTSWVWVALAATSVVGCVDAADDDATDLGDVADGKSDAPAIRDLAITVPKASASGAPGVRNFSVRASVDFDVAVAQPTTAAAPNQVTIVVTNLDTGAVVTSPAAPSPRIHVPATALGTGADASFKIRIENRGATTLHATLSALGVAAAVDPALLAAARANLDRVDKEIDGTHLQNYGLTGSYTDQFLAALAAEYETQHPDQYKARVTALASMAFFALPDIKPPTGGKLTPFHGLDSTQFDQLASIEDTVFSELVVQNHNSTNGVRPFSVCETKFIVETYVRPHVAYPGFTPYRAAYTTYAASCPRADRDDWYNFRGLGALRPSWVESNLADRFLRRMAKQCRTAAPAWATECTAWNADRLGYRQQKNRQLSARTMYYAPQDEAYLINPENPLVFLEDRDGDNVGEFLRPGAVTLTTGETGTLQVNSTGQFTGNLKFVGANGTARTVTPEKLVAEHAVASGWRADLLRTPDMGLRAVFVDGTGCTAASLDPASCPLLRRFYSLIDRHENFYKTYSALSPDYYGVSAQPSPLVACSITLGAAHAWDTAGIPPGGTAGFIYLMRIPFADILTGNDTSVATLMPGPTTTSIQSLYKPTGAAHLDMSRLWLDVASLSNNQYETEHEISAFGAVPASEIEGILVIRKPAAVH